MKIKLVHARTIFRYLCKLDGAESFKIKSCCLQFVFSYEKEMHLAVMF